MNLINEIKTRMDIAFGYFSIENGVLCNTHCLYPSNGMVQVAVMGAGDTYFVTDNGGAFREAEAAGASIKNPDRQYSKLLAKQGLTIENGVICSPKIGIESLPAAISIIANVSKEISESIFHTWKIERSRIFKDLVRDFIKTEFHVEVKEEKIIGQSNKSYSFCNVIDFMNGSKIIIDPVLKDPNSINARLVANLDVRSKHYPNLSQSIIYDDEQKWQPTDLNLLMVSGVPIIPFSKSEAILRQSFAQAS